MNDNEILIIAWWISLFTSVTAKSTSWSTVLFRPSHFFSLFEFKSSSCCQTTSLGAIHYFALPIRIFHFSREFATPVCQEKCYSATTSSSLSSVQRVANLRLPWGVEAFYKTKKGPEDHCPIPGIMLSIKVSQAASPQTLVSQQRRQARWGGRGGVPRVPASVLATAVLPRPGLCPCCSWRSWVVSPIPCPLAPLWWCWGFGKLASETEPWGFQHYRGKDTHSEILLILTQCISLVFCIWETPFTGFRTRCFF